jgi:hypothetical protein
LDRKVKLIRQAAQPPQRRADCETRINHLLFGKKDHAKLIETFWQLRFQLAEMLDAGCWSRPNSRPRWRRNNVIRAGEP